MRYNHPWQLCQKLWWYENKMIEEVSRAINFTTLICQIISQVIVSHKSNICRSQGMNNEYLMISYDNNDDNYDKDTTKIKLNE